MGAPESAQRLTELPPYSGAPGGEVPLPHPAPLRPALLDAAAPLRRTGFLPPRAPLLNLPGPFQAVPDLIPALAGAYGAVMSSSYNARPLAPELLVRGDTWAVVRPRQTVESLIGLDRLPPWIKPARPKGRKDRKSTRLNSSHRT